MKYFINEFFHCIPDSIIDKQDLVNMEIKEPLITHLHQLVCIKLFQSIKYNNSKFIFWDFSCWSGKSYFGAQEYKSSPHFSPDTFISTNHKVSLKAEYFINNIFALNLIHRHRSSKMAGADWRELVRFQNWIAGEIRLAQ